MSGKELLRTLKFLLFSLSAGIIELAAFTLLTELTHWSYWPSYLIALILSVVWNFTLNRRFTFQSAGNVPVAMAKVLAFYCVFTPVQGAGFLLCVYAGFHHPGKLSGGNPFVERVSGNSPQYGSQFCVGVPV